MSGGVKSGGVEVDFVARISATRLKREGTERVASEAEEFL